MKNATLLLVVILACYGQPAFAQYPETFSFVEVPDPLSGTNPTYPLVTMAAPAIGQSFTDPHFETLLVRATQTDGIHGRHEYARFDPFNEDQTLILLDPDAGWNVYSTQSYPYNQAGNLVMTVDLAEPRWDPDDPNVIWGVDYEETFRIKTVNVSTGATTIIKDFAQDPTIGPIIAQEPVYRITMMDEGESSRDKRYWALFLQGNDQVEYHQRYIFTWDRVQDAVLGVHEIAPDEVELDWVGMSPNGNWVLIGGDQGNGGQLDGLVLANRELTDFHQLDHTTAHADVALDIDGEEVIVMQNSRTDHVDLLPLSTQTVPVSEDTGTYTGTNRTPLVRLFYASDSPQGFQSGIHLSCNVPGYCVISTFIEPGLQEQNWLDRSIILVQLDRQQPRAFYLAKVHGTTGSYWEETHATITNDGSKVVWASNWDQQVGEEQVFLMALTMPPDWRTSVPTARDEHPSQQQGFGLRQNFPNPFHTETSIEYQLPRAGHVRMRVYNLLGQEVKNLVDDYHPAGRFVLTWDGSSDTGQRLPSGTYFCRLVSASLTQTRHLTVIR